ncbi:TPA: hypothetical protein KKW30_000739 [Legionella pneumophila]|nr:hypothetical protein [Legionella pneumophila]CZG38375.1 Uncharacterised protein [Legionella pneumophila]CZI23529.1 Uncharacterised protein [Legionella pneumophila]CZP81259.1 Uncharacterised protein [Legionella pneumophila]STX84075.1 Uncharacterised protein [Legionella pneumophila]HAT1700064.1 hypothetical protein [Legionella pneumophila]
MKKNNKQKDHPEVKEIENICDISPKTKITKDVCEQVNNNRDTNKKNSGNIVN